MQQLIPLGNFAFCGNQVEKTTKNTRAAIFEVNFEKKQEELLQIREREQLIRSTMTWGLLRWPCEGTNSDVSEDGRVPTTECFQDTKRRQLATRSGLQRLRCCVCHLHQKQAMAAPATVRQFFKTVLQQVHHFKIDVIAGHANAAAYRYYKKQVYQDLNTSSVAVRVPV